ncbi:MAG: putative transcriptional regulator, TetR family protein [Acidimicrobiales bacterium]|nr:MAG: putative transcriptional regulator, TetR family protein [Acidimicrobiales bacterium]
MSLRRFRYAHAVAKQRIDRTEVIAAAMRVADRDGLDEVALARVADDLGVQPSALYNHVDGVDGLFQDMTQQAAHNLADSLLDAAIARSGGDALRAVATAYRDFAQRHPGQYASLLLPVGREVSGDTSPHETITTVLARIVAPWGYTGDAAIHAARVIRSSIHGFVTLEASGAFVNPQETDESFAALLDFIVSGIEQPDEAPAVAP